MTRPLSGGSASRKLRSTSTWDNIKAQFLKTYKPKYSARTTCANFADLAYRVSKSVDDYHLRVHQAYKKLFDSKPEAVLAIRAATGVAAAIVKKEGLDDLAKFFKHQLILTRLFNHLRDMVLDAKKETFFESLDLAKECDAILHDHCHSVKTAALKAKMAPEEVRTINWEELMGDEIEQDTALGAWNNRFSLKKN
jgi:hypothetical protein